MLAMPATIIIPVSITCAIIIFFLANDLFFTNALISPPVALPIRRVSGLLGSRSNNPAFFLGNTSTSYSAINAGDYVRTPFTFRSLQYVVEVRLGSLKVPAHLLLDTGSTLPWWQCFPCRKCFEQDDPEFMPYRSTSYSDVNCLSKDCPRREFFSRGCKNGVNQHCGYELTYADGDHTVGRLGMDDLSTVDGSLVARINFGCAGFNNGTHFSPTYAGILGFSLGDFSFPSQIKASSYSFCLLGSEAKESFLYLHDSPPPTGRAITVPLLVNPRNAHMHYVQFSRIEIGKRTVKIDSEKWSIDSNGNYGVMIDTGAVITRLPQDMYVILRDAFRYEFSDYEDSLVEKNPEPMLDTCYDFYYDNKDVVDELPDITLYFFDTITKKDSPLKLGWDQVMVQRDRESPYVRYCFAFAVYSRGSHITTTLGSFQLQGTRLSYDTDKMTLRLDPNNC